MKKTADLEVKIKRLVCHYGYRGLEYGSVFSSNWFYVANERIKTAVENARDELKEDEQGRVSALVNESLLPSKFR